MYLEVNVSHPGGKKFDSFVLTGVSTHLPFRFLPLTMAYSPIETPKIYEIGF